MAEKPTILVDTFFRAGDSAAGANSYKGLAIHALPGLHEFVADKALEFLSAGASVLDIAAGSGAMCQRLLDLGFRVSATDYVRKNFRLESVPFIRADLNQPFASTCPSRYQGIIACEIIEHLENPRHFARQCFELLDPGGRMVLTTPNVDSASSKASFIRFGTFFWFDDERYQVDGHITPITQWQIDKAFTEAGFTFLWKGSFGDPMRLTAGSPRLRLVARAIALATRQGSHLGGEVFVAVLEKPRSAG
jgi:cyclopropane fatty-acyl-phospholipid synthase-like methyltransferase